MSSPEFSVLAFTNPSLPEIFCLPNPWTCSSALPNSSPCPDNPTQCNQRPTVSHKADLLPCLLCAVWQITFHLRHTLLLLFLDRLTEPFINRRREFKIVLQRFMAWTLAYIQGYATPHRLSCKQKHSHKCLQKMLLRWVHHLLFFFAIYLVLVSTPICHKKPRRHCKLFKANMHSANCMMSIQQALSE